MTDTFLHFIQRPKTQDAAIAILLLALLSLLQLVIFFGVGGRDDSYITYWSAYSLSEMGEIVNYNGDRIEQSSSLLHTLLLAGIHKFSGASIPTLGIIFSVSCGLITALLAGRLARDVGITFYKWIPFVIVFVPYFSYWSSSGMETSLVALCIIIFLITLKDFLENPFSKKGFLFAAFSMALYILVRPESILVLVTFFTLALLFAAFKANNNEARITIKKLGALLLTALILFLCLASWRYFYFGQVFPQPVYAKTDITHWADRIIWGLRYVEYSLNFSTALLSITMVSGIVISLVKKLYNKNLTPCFLFLLAYLAFVICAGGDWMEGRRFLVPVIPILCLLAIAALNNKNRVYPLVFLFFCLALTDSWRFAKQESIGLPPTLAAHYAYLAGQIKPNDTRLLEYDFSPLDMFNYSHLRDMLTIPAMDELTASLSKNGVEPVNIASRQMGMIPYYIASKYYKKVRFIDLRGLVTKDIPDCHFISDSKPKSSSGILITSRHYLEYQHQISSDCSLPPVDIIYDTGLISNTAEATAAVLAANGYRLYYAQHGNTDNLFAQYIGVNNRHQNIIP